MIKAFHLLSMWDAVVMETPDAKTIAELWATSAELAFWAEELREQVAATREQARRTVEASRLLRQRAARDAPGQEAEALTR